MSKELIKNYQLEIDGAVQQLGFNGSPKELYEPMAYLLSLGGKRLRPALLLMSAKMFGLQSNDVMPQALAIEVFHNFTLMHDDIMDQAPLRRGKKTVHEKWNRDIAILSGDAMMVLAYQLMLDTDSPHVRTILQIFNKTAIEVCEGQQEDMNFESRKDVAVSEYLEMIRKKTSVLLAASLEIGAVLAGALEEDNQILYEFGVSLGMAFQLRDDLLDSFGAEGLGKQLGGDIRANKKTILLLRLLEKANDKEKGEMLSKVAANKEDEKVAYVLDLMKKYGVDVSTQELIEYYTKKALQYLDKIQLPEKNKEELRAITEFLLLRKS